MNVSDVIKQRLSRVLGRRPETIWDSYGHPTAVGVARFPRSLFAALRGIVTLRNAVHRHASAPLLLEQIERRLHDARSDTNRRR
jgi:hypothetical protein